MKTIIDYWIERQGMKVIFTSFFVMLICLSINCYSNEEASEIQDHDDFFKCRMIAFTKQLKEQFKNEEDNAEGELVHNLRVDDELLKMISKKYKVYDVFQYNDNCLRFVMDYPKNEQLNIEILIQESSKLVNEAMITHMASCLSYSNMHFSPAKAIPVESEFHCGDCCVYSQNGYILFSRANVGIILWSAKELADIAPIAKLFDDKIINTLVATDWNEPETPGIIFNTSHHAKRKRPLHIGPQLEFLCRKFQSVCDDVSWGIRRAWRGLTGF